jgi:hypothetical protein
LLRDHHSMMQAPPPTRKRALRAKTLGCSAG